MATTPEEVMRLQGKESKGRKPGRGEPQECQEGRLGLGKAVSEEWEGKSEHNQGGRTRHHRWRYEGQEGVSCH